MYSKNYSTVNYVLEVKCKYAGSQGPILRCYAVEGGKGGGGDEDGGGGEAFFYFNRNSHTI